MAVLSIFVFGTALAVSVWALLATIAPEAGRIADLLVNGPVSTPLLPAPVASRGGLRQVRVRQVSTTARSRQQRAAA